MNICAGRVSLWAAPYFWRNAKKFERAMPAPFNPKIIAVIVAVFGVGLLAYATTTFAGDYLLDRREAAGRVTKKYVRHVLRPNSLTDYYYVEIDGHRFLTTADIYAQIEPATEIHAMVGRGTGKIFSTTN
jgi:hypothetical protein